MSTREAGKGDTYRPVDHEKWSENYDRIFRSNESMWSHYCLEEKGVIWTGKGEACSWCGKTEGV